MLEQKILETITKYEMIENGDNIVIGVSGGPDSMALLNSLINIRDSRKIKFDIYVAHVNHKLRKEADEETKYVNEFCSKNGIKCYIEYADVAQIAIEKKVGTEELGRKIRYDFFQAVENKVRNLILTENKEIKNEDEIVIKIATAHNSNDNAETVIMNILRGSGTSGLKGIDPINGKIIRPLIECSRKEIEKYCEIEKLEPKIDKSNQDNTYTRNKVRNIVIPYLEDNFNPNIINTITRLSDIVSEENQYIEKKTEEAYRKILINEQENEIVLSNIRFCKQDEVIQKRLILYTINKLQKNAKDISNIHIIDIVKLCNNNIGNKKISPKKGLQIYLNHGRIYFLNLIKAV